MTFTLASLLLLIIFQRIQLLQERRAHRDTKRALIWWRDERAGRHGHGTPCDGDHALPACDDPECWQREDI
jgi:hypothetical protein